MVSCATSLNASDVNECLRAPGRLDHTVALQPPSSSERQNMLKAIVEARSVKCNTQALQVCEQNEATQLARLPQRKYQNPCLTAIPKTYILFLLLGCLGLFLQQNIHFAAKQNTKFGSEYIYSQQIAAWYLQSLLWTELPTRS